MRGDEALRVDDVSGLLGIGRNKVYELANSGELASYHVGRKLRFTLADVQRYIEQSKTGGPVGAATGAPASGASAVPVAPAGSPIPETVHAASPFVISGGDAAGDVIAAAFARAGVAARREYLDSYTAMVDAYFGRSHAVVAHLFDAKTGTYNVPFVQRVMPGVPVSIVRLGGRDAGVIVAKGNPKRIHSWGSLLTRQATIANVKRGSAARVLLDQQLMLMEARPSSLDGYDREAANVDVAAKLVACGAADACVGTADIAAADANLEFLPMQREWIDLVVVKTPETRRLVTAAKHLAANPWAKARLAAAGLDISKTGAIVYES